MAALAGSACQVLPNATTAPSSTARFPGADTLSQETSLTLIRAFGTLNTLLDGQLANFGLSRPRLHVLAFLNRAGNEVRMTDSGKWLSVNKANVTRLVDGLEREGLVARSERAGPPRDPGQHYSYGRTRLDSALPHHVEYVGHLFGPLSDNEKLMLIRLLARAREAMLSGTGDGQPPDAAFPI